MHIDQHSNSITTELLCILDHFRLVSYPTPSYFQRPVADTALFDNRVSFLTISADSRIRRCFLNKKLHYIVYPFLSTHFLMGNTLFNTFPNKHWASDRHAAHVYIGSVGPGAILDIYSTFMVGHPNCGPSLNVDM